MAAESAQARPNAAKPPATLHPAANGEGEGNEEALRRETQQLMWSNVGIVRDAVRLSGAVTRLEAILAQLPPASSSRRAEARNIAQSGLAIARSALARKESRGGHYRSDFPAKDDANFRKHSVLASDSVRFE